MGYVRTGTDAAGHDLRVHYADLGQGPVIVLMHGWAATHAMWEHQLAELPKHGFRVVAHTRRGGGLSDHPWEGHDYDTLADDLRAALDYLDLQDVTLVGFSMGGGEVARYMGRHGGARVARVAFVSAVPPFMLKTADNPAGIAQAQFDGVIAGLQGDRFESFDRVQPADVWRAAAAPGREQRHAELAAKHLPDGFAPRHGAGCGRVQQHRFSGRPSEHSRPYLVVHGSADQVWPLTISGARLPDFIPQVQLQVQLIVYDGAPHGLFVTEKVCFNRDLLAFARGQVVVPVPEAAPLVAQEALR